MQIFDVALGSRGNADTETEITMGIVVFTVSIGTITSLARWFNAGSVTRRQQLERGVACSRKCGGTIHSWPDLVAKSSPAQRRDSNNFRHPQKAAR
jgi:hypothetical protein